MASKPGELDHAISEFKFTQYVQEVEGYLKDKLIPTVLKHLRDECTKKQLMSSSDIDKVVAFKTEQAHRRLSKYLDALEILAPQKIVNDVDYREYRESKLQEVEQQQREQQRINELVEEYARKKQQQLLNRQLQELERELQSATLVHNQSDHYLEATKQYDRILEYQEDMLKYLDAFEKKLEDELRK